MKRGIVVDDALETNVAGIHAIGECAEHRGICYGLVEPAHEQARVLAERLAGRDARYPGSVLATNLKVSGVNVFSAGDFLGSDGTDEIVLSDPGLGIYKKLVIADGRLIGAVLFGDTADGLWYLDLIRSGADIDRIRDDLAFGRAFAERAAPARTRSWRLTCPAISPPSRSAISKASSPACRRRARRAARLPAASARADRAGCDPSQGAGPRHRGRRQARRPGEIQARAASVRCLRPAEGSRRRTNEPPKPADNFRWRYYGLFYVAPAQTSYMCRLRIPNGILKHWQFAGVADLADRCGGPLFARHHARQSADPRDRAEARRRGRRRHPEPRPVVARLRRRQHPQRHRHADRRHRPAGADRHAAAMRASGTSTFSTTARSTACRASSMSPSTAAASSRCWRTPTTSASRPSR